MPVAGDEGYEHYVTCPYDRSHEIRKGRMQFHLEKCRRNFPDSNLVECPYNKMHRIREPELTYHMEEDCESRSIWEHHVYASDKEICPVRDLVPVNAATVPDGGENWDNCEATGSVLDHIKSQTLQKPVLRMLQVASKAQRKAFRKQERERHQALANAQTSNQSELAKTCTASVRSPTPSEAHYPLRKPKVQPELALRVNRAQAMAIIERQTKNLDLSMDSHAADVPPSETSSMVSSQPSASTSRQAPTSIGAPMSTTQQMSYSNAAASRSGVGRGRGLIPSQPSSRPGSSMSTVSTGTYVTANRPSSVASFISTSRPNTVISNDSFHTSNRPSSGMSNISYHTLRQDENDDGFCQTPIPGIGRGRRKNNQ